MSKSNKFLLLLIFLLIWFYSLLAGPQQEDKRSSSKAQIQWKKFSLFALFLHSTLLTLT